MRWLVDRDVVVMQDGFLKHELISEEMGDCDDCFGYLRLSLDY